MQCLRVSHIIIYILHTANCIYRNYIIVYRNCPITPVPFIHHALNGNAWLYVRIYSCNTSTDSYIFLGAQPATSNDAAADGYISSDTDALPLLAKGLRVQVSQPSCTAGPHTQLRCFKDRDRSRLDARLRGQTKLVSKGLCTCCTACTVSEPCTAAAL